MLRQDEAAERAVSTKESFMSERDGTGHAHRVVVAGAGFAGLGAAYTLRQRLPDATVTVVSPTPYFVFAPSLIWTPFGRTMEQTYFDVEPALAQHQIDFVRSPVRAVRLGDKRVSIDDGELEYDRLIIATGGQPAAHEIPGLVGEFRAATWIVGEDSAMDARTVLQRLSANPGPLVVGVAQGASYYSAAYELALLIDSELRREGIRERVPITFITCERTLGDLGFGQTATASVLAEIFEERGIPYRTGISIAAIEQGRITLGDGDVLPAEAAFIMPPFTGSSDIWKSAGLTDSTGLIPVNRRYQHVKYPEVYAAGIASYFLHPVQPLEQQHAPATGYLSLRMGVIAAENVSAALGHGEEAGRALPELIDLRVLDGGQDGVLISSRGTTELHNSARRLPGPVAHRAKESIERYLVWKLRTGHVTSFQVPAVERV